jgi:hypothetical protein
LLHTLKDVPRSHRIGLPDDGRTLVLCPMRPEKVDRLSTGQSTVVNVADGRVKFRCTYRFRPATWGGDGAGQSPLIDRVQQAAFRLDGSLLTVDDVGITRWDIDSGKLLEDYNEPTLAFSVSANEKRIAVRCW